MAKRIIFALIFLFISILSYASEITPNYSLEIPSVGARDWQPVISKDIISIDAVLGVISNDAVTWKTDTIRIDIISSDSAIQDTKIQIISNDSAIQDVKIVIISSDSAIQDAKITTISQDVGLSKIPTYITQTTNGQLTNEQAIGSLSSGIMRVANTTGAITSLGDVLPTGSGGTGATANANAASGVVILDATSKLPAVDGSLLTGIPAGLTKLTTTTFTADTSKSISLALAPSNRYYADIKLVKNTSDGDIQIHFNNDTGNNYKYYLLLQVEDGVALVLASVGTIGRIDFAGYGGDPTVLTNAPICGQIYFQTVQGDNTVVMAEFNSFYFADDSKYEIQRGYGYYNGAANLVSMDITTTAGTITGTVVLYQFN